MTVFFPLESLRLWITSTPRLSEGCSLFWKLSLNLSCLFLLSRHLGAPSWLIDFLLRSSSLSTPYTIFLSYWSIGRSAMMNSSSSCSCIFRLICIIWFSLLLECIFSLMDLWDAGRKIVKNCSLTSWTITKISVCQEMTRFPMTKSLLNSAVGSSVNSLASRIMVDMSFRIAFRLPLFVTSCISDIQYFKFAYLSYNVTDSRCSALLIFHPLEYQTYLNLN